MKALEKALHCLRPLVEAEKWDYLVVWECGDDPSRFIKWVGCCCSNAHGFCENIEKEKIDETKVGLCRDTFLKHFAKYEACLELEKFPIFIPLYSGLHGETVLSTEATWLGSCDKDSSLNLFHELAGTRVLIPVVGGLVELFTTRNVPKDEKLIEFVKSWCNMNMEDELIPAQSYVSTKLDVQHQISLIGRYTGTDNYYLNLSYSPNIPNFFALPQPSTYPSLAGSSTDSKRTPENVSLISHSSHVSPNGSVNELIGKAQRDTMTDGANKDVLENDVVSGLDFGKNSSIIESDYVNSALKMEKEPYQSKNLVTERRRRTRINEGLLTLRSLVPKISKMDKASIIVDAIAFIKELQIGNKQLEDEVKEMTEDEINEKTNPSGQSTSVKVSNPSKVLQLNSDNGAKPEKRNRDYSGAPELEKSPVEIKVKQIGKRDFSVKLLHTHKQGGFTRLMKVLSSLGLQVIGVNTTTHNGQMMNSFEVEANKMGVQPKILKKSLIKLMSNLQ